jgi:hypothetical protein
MALPSFFFVASFFSAFLKKWRGGFPACAARRRSPRAAIETTLAYSPFRRDHIPMNTGKVIVIHH